MRETDRSIWNELALLQEQIDTLFGSAYLEDYYPKGGFLLRGNNVLTGNYRKPLSDMRETDKEIIALIEMPGMNKEDIYVEVKDNALEIKAERKQEIEETDEEERYSYKKDFSGFYKKLLLPENVDAQKAEAEYKNGILEIIVPKLEIESSKKKRLSIK